MAAQPQLRFRAIQPQLSQVGRFGVMSTPLGGSKDNKDANGNDFLALVRFDGNEGLSELFNYTVEAISLDREIDFNFIMGKPCTVAINTVGGLSGRKDAKRLKRVFNGLLVAAESLGSRQGAVFGYRLILRPWLWVLTRTTNCRIFQDKDVPTIIQEIFEANGFSGAEFEFHIDGPFPKLDYCVQYRESDYNFVSRLMEKEGIYYFFRHEAGAANDLASAKHVLVLTNSMSKHLPVPEHEQMVFSAVERHSVGDQEKISDWSHTRQMRSGKTVLNDYNYETPKTQMLAPGGENTALVPETYKFFDKELYDYPGNYKNLDAGKRYATIALESEQAPDHRRIGGGHAISLFPGGLINLVQLPTSSTRDLAEENRLPPPSEFKKYLVVRTVHAFGTQEYRSAPGAMGESFQGRYQFHDAASPFRAPMITPKPRIYGIQTALVVDKQGRRKTDNPPATEEIEVEKLTEVYLHFYWDRNQAKDPKERRSVKVRCAQLWAGPKWGGQFIPRIGMEVVVEFLEGDPDRPIVTGCVYNDDNQPPYDLPANKTKSGIKSESSKGGHGFNEWNFEDKKGQEQINVHAQKDLNVTVLNNETRSVGADIATTISNSETRTVGEKFKTPKGSPSRTTTIKNGDDNLDIAAGHRITTIKNGDDNLDIAAGHRNTVIWKGDDSLNVSQGSHFVWVKKKIDITADDEISLTAKNKITLTVGDSTVTMEPKKITLTVDQSTITMEPQKVAIASSTINTESQLKTTVQGGAALDLLGALIKLN